MTIQYASDLHLEREGNQDFYQQNPLIKRAEVLILAGDIAYLKEGHFSMPFFDQISSMYEEVFIVPGNHEFYLDSLDIARTFPTFELKIRDNVTYVNNATKQIGNTRILFTTLYTRIHHKKELSEQMSDFTYAKFEGATHTPDRHNDCHAMSKHFLNNELRKPFQGETVIVSHHVPFAHTHCPYKLEPQLNEAIHVDMSLYLESFDINHWIYGHNHYNKPSFLIYGTTFHSNQLGYVSYGHHRRFQRDKVLNV